MTGPLEGEPADTREAIVAATYRALCEHGYADLTIQAIADEFGKSKSLLYHHYEGKDDLLVDFLAYVLDRFETAMPAECGDDAAGALRAFLDRAVPERPDDEHGDFLAAIVELRAQAATDPAYAEHFGRSDRLVRERLARIVERGVADGTFREVDPEVVADALLTVVVGAMTRRATVEEADVAPTREALDAYVEHLRRGNAGPDGDG